MVWNPEESVLNRNNEAEKDIIIGTVEGVNIYDKKYLQRNLHPNRKYTSDLKNEEVVEDIGSYLNDMYPLTGDEEVN